MSYVFQWYLINSSEVLLNGMNIITKNKLTCVRKRAGSMHLSFEGWMSFKEHPSMNRKEKVGGTDLSPANSYLWCCCPSFVFPWQTLCFRTIVLSLFHFQQLMPFTEEHEDSCAGPDDGSHLLPFSGISQEQAPEAQGKDILKTTGTFLTHSPNSW